MIERVLRAYDGTIPDDQLIHDPLVPRSSEFRSAAKLIDQCAPRK